MMKQFLLILIIAIVACDKKKEGKNQTYHLKSEKISDYEIYEVINAMVDSSNSDCANHTQYLVELDWLETGFVKRLLDQTEELDSIFSRKDVEFIRIPGKIIS